MNWFPSIESSKKPDNGLPKLKLKWKGCMIPSTSREFYVRDYVYLKLQHIIKHPLPWEKLLSFWLIVMDHLR